ncbi:glutamate--cysteine ligase [soil metagenome]
MPIRSSDELLVPFQAHGGAEKIGPEAEKFGILEHDLSPLRYEGGVLRVLDSLRDHHGWIPDFEKPGGPLIALKRSDASVTLEPGCQLELSGAPAMDVHEIAAELSQHLAEIAPASRELGVRWLSLGFHPFAKREDLDWVPKARYGIMKTYLPTRGGHAVDMMLRTSTVQSNLDYSSEADAIRKVRIAQRISPLTSAMFANSPYVEGKRAPLLSMRCRVWLDVDGDRSGLLESLFSETASVGDYIDWALDVPMFLFKRGTDVIANTGQTFRSFMKDGYEGHRPTQADWQLHVNTLFPDVRLKRTIEIRSADAQGFAMTAALPALYAGLFYDARALDEVDAYTASWTFSEVDDLRSRVYQLGIRTPFRGATAAEAAEKIIEIAEGGLARRKRTNARGEDERTFLAPLKTLVAARKTPADILLEKVGDDPRNGLLAAAELLAPD